MIIPTLIAPLKRPKEKQLTK